MEKNDLLTIPLFRNIGASELEHLLRLATALHYEQGDVILRQGEPGQRLIVLRQGLVAVRVAGPEGEERTLVHLGPGQILGEIALVDQGPHAATVVAVQPTEAIAIPAQAFWAFCEAHPEVGLRLLRNLASDLAFKLRHTDLSFV